MTGITMGNVRAVEDFQHRLYYGTFGYFFAVVVFVFFPTEIVYIKIRGCTGKI